MSIIENLEDRVARLEALLGPIADGLSMGGGAAVLRNTPQLFDALACHRDRSSQWNVIDLERRRAEIEKRDPS